MVGYFILKVSNFSYLVTRMMSKGPTEAETRSDRFKKSFGKRCNFGTENIYSASISNFCIGSITKLVKFCAFFLMFKSISLRLVGN